MNPIALALSSSLLALAMAVVVPTPARAGLMLQPFAASTNMGTSGGVINNVRNQSGLLPSGYSSEMTDFASYTASTVHNSSSFGTNSWQSSSSVPGNVDFDLGGVHVIEAFALWNLGSIIGFNDAAVQNFTLLASSDDTFTTTTLLGDFVANAPSANLVPAQIFTFSPTAAAFVRMEITSNHGQPGGSVGFGEAAFEVRVNVIPEPSTLAMMVPVAVAGLGAVWQKRRGVGGRS